MAVVLAFDVYGTLIDTHGVMSRLETMLAAGAKDFSQTWRDKQLEYSFRRGLMQNYADFATCTRQALDYTSQYYGASLTPQQKIQLLDCYRALPAFDDVRQALSGLQQAGYRLYAFSNGSEQAVEELLQNAGIRSLFDGIVSCDELKSFKPNPAVYSHFLRKSNASAGDAWLVSSNAFDVIGALSAGLRAAWVQRSSSVVFDPWGIEPSTTIGCLSELHNSIVAAP